MNTDTEALQFLDDHSKWLAESWSMSPEGREYKVKFDLAIDIIRRASAKSEPAESYVHAVPDKCDRITWRENYHHLPIAPAESGAVRLPPITDEDRQFLHDNPNTDEVVEWVQNYARAAIAEQARPAEREPVAWIRFCSDGTYEGPLTHARMDDVRKKSGAWTPLYAAAPQPQEQDHQAELRGEAPAWRDVLAERQRQVSVEGWTPQHDDQHDSGVMADAAACYARNAHGDAMGRQVLSPTGWPWNCEWWKPGTPRRMLVKAGALILAEIERLDRADPQQRSNTAEQDHPVGGGAPAGEQP